MKIKSLRLRVFCVENIRSFAKAQLQSRKVANHVFAFFPLRLRGKMSGRLFFAAGSEPCCEAC